MLCFYNDVVFFVREHFFGVAVMLVDVCYVSEANRI